MSLFWRLTPLFTLVFFLDALGHETLEAQPLTAHLNHAEERAGIDAESLAQLVSEVDAPRLRVVGEQEAMAGVRRQVMAFTVDGLAQYGLLLTPTGAAPADGWPLLVFNHGFHPNPPDYGLRGSTGKRERPGDYYRGVPQAYAEQGFVVFAPDFRGHADSEGSVYAQSALATHWYVRDAIQAFRAARALPSIDRARLYMAGHSMGAYVTLRSALVLGDVLQAISLWSTSGDDPLTYLYSIDLNDSASDRLGAASMDRSDRLRNELAALDLEPMGITTFDQLSQIRVPVQLHHGREDASTPVWNSLAVASRLRIADRPYRLFIYATDSHLFQGHTFEEAIERDVQWFTDAP